MKIRKTLGVGAVCVAIGALTAVGDMMVTFDWSNYAADDWSGHIEQTVDDLTLNGDGRTFVQGAGQMAFQAIFVQPEVGTFTVEDAGNVVRDFTVMSVDLAASTEGTTFVGMMGASEQWSISVPNDSTWATYTTPTTGDMGLEIDSIVWSSAGTNWGNRMDNMTVNVIPEPSTLALFGLSAVLLMIRRRRV